MVSHHLRAPTDKNAGISKLSTIHVRDKVLRINILRMYLIHFTEHQNNFDKQNNI